MIYILAAKIDRTFLFAKQAGIKCALLSLISHLEVLANPPIPATSAHPPPHRPAVAGVPDEGGGVGAVAAADGDGGVTGRLGRRLHLIAIIIASIIAPASRKAAISAPPMPLKRDAWVISVLLGFIVHTACTPSTPRPPSGTGCSPCPTPGTGGGRRSARRCWDAGRAGSRVCRAPASGGGRRRVARRPAAR